MSYPCKLIQDLLPLYHDGVCSDESREIIGEHLTNCAECSGILEEIRAAESVSIPADHVREAQKTDSLKKIKKKLLRQQIIIAVTALFTAAAVLFGVSFFLMSSLQTVKAENLSVQMIDGELVCVLHGGFLNSMSIKNVEVSSDDGVKYYMFFSMEESKWDRLVRSRSEYKEVLAYNPQNIERVYYYTGDNTWIDFLPEEELNIVIDRSTLMWSK